MNSVLLKSAKIPVLGVPLNSEELNNGRLKLNDKRKPKATVKFANENVVNQKDHSVKMPLDNFLMERGQKSGLNITTTLPEYMSAFHEKDT